MTTTYDPHHPKYLDEADVRDELTRVYDHCHGCRLCFKFCTSFPTLFEAIDKHDDQDSAKLTKVEQDQVIDECFQCKLCDINCPYTPAKGHEWALDFPRLMLRASAMRRTTGQIPARQRLTDTVMARTDLIGAMASGIASPVANATIATPGSFARRIVEKTAGVSAERLLPPFARVRFSTWFKRRHRAPMTRRQGRVAVFSTCLVEYQAPAIGHDLVKVYERNGIECHVPDVGCCGAPHLHSGDIDGFTKMATANVERLARVVRGGDDIVVPQPTCSFVLKRDYLDYVGGPDAELVAEHTFDACEYLMKVHKAPDTALDTEFDGDVPETVTYHTPCHLRAQNIGLKGRDLMKLTGTTVKLVQQCSGIDGMWGLKAANVELSLPIGRKLGDAITAAGGETVAGDCHLANGVITEQTGRVPQHPLQVLARAYGIEPEVER